MKAFSASVARKDPSSNNVYIDLLDLDNEPLLECHALHREIIERYKGGTRNRLFIDEVQLCGGFEKAINSIHARGGWDVCLTGLNASSPAREYPPLGMTAVKEVPSSSMLNTRSYPSNPIRLTEQSAPGSTSPCT